MEVQVQYTDKGQLKISKEFSQVLLMACAICLQYMVTMYAFTMRARVQIYSRDFLRQFDQEHRAAFESTGQNSAARDGYPDTGNGFYSRKLDYHGWFKMNCGQRVQINFLEQLTFIVLFTCLAGLSFPNYAVWCQFGYFLGRLCFSVGYMSYGPNGRLVGAICMDLFILAALVLSVISLIQMFSI